MASELRIRCFLDRPPAIDTPDTLEARGRTTEIRESLLNLLETLEESSGDFLVKVMVHRKLDGN